MKAQIPEKGKFIETKKDVVKGTEMQENDLPILISVEDDESKTFLIQTKDYKFAQFLAMVQNRCSLEIINRILEEGLSGEADQEGINNLIHFCDLLYLWSKKAINIDDDILKTLKGEPENESDSN